MVLDDAKAIFLATVDAVLHYMMIGDGDHIINPCDWQTTLKSSGDGRRHGICFMDVEGAYGTHERSISLATYELLRRSMEFGF